MRNKDYYCAVISTNRPQNVAKMQELTGGCTFFVKSTDIQAYKDAGAMHVMDGGENICTARNLAIKLAEVKDAPCIQVSDDLKSIKMAEIEGDKTHLTPITFHAACIMLISELMMKNFFYAGVAVSSNRLNYTGKDVSYNKLVVNDLICVMPKAGYFDEDLALKEDYDFTLRNIFERGGLVRLDNILCDFPHRENKGGANDYRNSASEDAATKKLMAKWGKFIIPHKTREGQVSINYKAVKEKINGQESLF